MFNKLLLILQLIRLKQWVKNFFIFFPLIFSGQFFLEGSFWHVAKVFLGFSLLASSFYVLNDALDLEKDRLHPKKSKRPLAQGKIPINFVIGLIIVLFITGLGILYFTQKEILFPAAMYIVLNVIYNFYTKRIVLLDVMFVAFGFYIRIWIGSLSADVFPSHWLQLCVFLLALFLGFTKRRHEYAVLKEKASAHRDVLASYSLYFLDQLILICSTLAIVFYGLYTISSEITSRLGTHSMIYSTVFVIYGIFRYLYLVHVKKQGGDPGEVLFSDFPLFICVLGWILYVAVLLYGGGVV